MTRSSLVARWHASPRHTSASGLIAALAILVLSTPVGAEDVAAPQSFEVIEADIASVQAAFDAGILTADGLTRSYLARIQALDRNGPRLNSFIAVNEHAAEDAAALDAERAASGPRGPLHGIPVVVRDNLDTLELPTTAGSASLRGHEPLRDAFIVARLRAAGA
ncbi:MAG: amidase family protein, partial [Thiohalocapsa sp.]